MTVLARRPVLARSRGQLARSLANLRRRRATVALVPTMGALHDGHRGLIRAAHDYADAVTVSIFVNPLQFGAGEDLDSYPRGLDADLDVCEQEDADLVFAPEPSVVYPRRPQSTVAAGPLARRYEGASRPDHFDGVLTVVAKLFHLIGPDVAMFGEKDFQQLTLVRGMVDDLDFAVHIVSVPIVREADGLAASSRNRYLTAPQRAAALALPQALAAGAGQAAFGPGAVRRAAARVLDAARAVDVDYLALVDETSFDGIGDAFTGMARLLLAARVGATRLIDNTHLDLGTAVRSRE